MRELTCPGGLKVFSVCGRQASLCPKGENSKFQLENSQFITSRVQKMCYPMLKLNRTNMASFTEYLVTDVCKEVQDEPHYTI